MRPTHNLIMPKWVSPLFTDIRNGLGESVVFSMWKGRPYFRSWVRPANPQTNLQQVRRDIMRNLVARYQSEIIVSQSAPEHSATWNSQALPYQISGANLFVKFGAKSLISVPATASGVGSANVTVTYTLGFPASKAKIYYLKGSTWTRVETALAAGDNQQVVVAISTPGTYEFWLANDEALDAGDAAPQAYQAITKWGLPTGAPLNAAKAASCVVSVS
jgi:hypothetical protein